jgi:hypothetical protein
LAEKSEQKDKDVVVSSKSVKGDAYPEGTHPARPPSEVTHSPDRFVYRDNPDKPDPSSIAQVVEEK